MKLAHLKGFDAERFLDQYWQRQPCLIEAWLKPRPQPLGELLRLAETHDLPTRLVSGRQERADWMLTHGPLDAGDLPDGADWTLLVQEMDKISPAVADILAHFRFLPDWMIDDVMISQAADGGSVGAHVDAYDVFLVQAEGQRQWELAARYDQQLDERFEMALLANWASEVSIRVNPGDVLYLPAGVAHHGVAVGPCQTWSVGLRTPSGPEMLFYLAESLVESGGQRERLKPARPGPLQPALVNPATVTEARKLLKDCLSLDDQALGGVMARMLTSWRLWHDELALDHSEPALRHLAAGHPLSLSSSTRLALLGQGESQQLFVNGESINCPSELAAELASSRRLSPAWHDQPGAIEQLVEVGAIATPPGPHVVASR
jgi:50S ribosomal protein L16 3-hydroxylase